MNFEKLLDWTGFKLTPNGCNDCYDELAGEFKGAVSRNSAKLGNHKMPVKLGETYMITA